MPKTINLFGFSIKKDSAKIIRIIAIITIISCLCFAVWLWLAYIANMFTTGLLAVFGVTDTLYFYDYATWTVFIIGAIAISVYIIIKITMQLH